MKRKQGGGQDSLNVLNSHFLYYGVNRYHPWTFHSFRVQILKEIKTRNINTCRLLP